MNAGRIEKAIEYRVRQPKLDNVSRNLRAELGIRDAYGEKNRQWDGPSTRKKRRRVERNEKKSKMLDEVLLVVGTGVEQDVNSRLAKHAYSPLRPWTVMPVKDLKRDLVVGL